MRNKLESMDNHSHSATISDLTESPLQYYSINVYIDLMSTYMVSIKF